MNAIPRPHILYELLRLTFEHLDNDKPSLCAISLCSSAFHQEAQRIQFSDVTTLQSDSTILIFLRTVSTSPHHLAPLVRAFRNSGCATSNELWTAVCDGLKAMGNLKHLSILFSSLLTNTGCPASMLDGFTFHLERFEWIGDPSDSRRILHIVESAGTLEQRKYSRECPERSTTQNACPSYTHPFSGLGRKNTSRKSPADPPNTSEFKSKCAVRLCRG